MFKTFLFIFCMLCITSHARSDDGNTTASGVVVDTLTVKGAVLQGQVTGLTSDGLSFSLVYGQGSISIPFENIEQLSTEHYYHIFYNGKASDGKIVSIHNHHWLVVEDGNTQTLIDVRDIERFILSVHDDDSFSNQLHNALPFWSGNLDIGLEIEEGGVRKRKLDLNTRFEYNRLDHRLVIVGNREFDTQLTPGDENWSTSKDQYLFSIEDNYYVNRKREELLFVSSGFERDAVRQIKHRIYPAAGIGYRRTFSEGFWVNMQAGAGGVFDTYTAYGRENYAALYIGAESMYRFDRGPVLRAKVMYMPSLLHERSAWLFRFTGSLTVPVTEMFALKFIMEDIDDNNPYPDVGNNKVTTNFALSFNF